MTIDAPGRDLGPLRTLRGRVRWRDGAAVAGAEVVLHSSPLPAFPSVALARARMSAKDVTDAQGRFDLAWAPGGLWSLRVLLDGTARVSITDPPAGDEMEIVLAREPATLEIEAVDARTEAPVALEVVQLRYADGNSPQGWMVTWFGPGPRLRGTLLATGEARIFGRAKGHESIEGESVTLREGETTHVRLELHLGETVLGTVVDHETGAPVPGAKVSLGGSCPREVETDVRGAFELRNVPWDSNARRQVHVRAAGYAHAEREIGDVPDGGVEELEIRLVRPATLALRCVDEKGKPVRDILVLAETLTEIAPRCLGGDYASAVTGADGRASLAIAPGEFSAKVVCWRAGARVFERELPPLRPSELRELGDILAGRPRAIRGLVLTAEGAPAAGACVAVVPHDPVDEDHAALAVAVFVPDRGDRADAAGRFEVRGVGPGLWDLLVHGGGHPRLLRLGIAVPDRGDPSDLELRLPLPVALTGRVVDAKGQPVPRAKIDYVRSHPVSANLVETLDADAQGRFSIPAFTAEDPDVELSVSRPGAPEDDAVEFHAVPRDGPVEIRLP